MRRSSVLFALVLVPAAASSATAQGSAPSLRVRASCTDPDPVRPGEARAVSLDFLSGGRKVGAIGFTLRFDPGLLSVRAEDVVAGDAVAAVGDSVAADVDATAGAVRVLVVPQFAEPQCSDPAGRVCPIPEGEAVRVTLKTAAGATSGCVPLALEGVSFSDALVGLRIQPGPSTDGGIAIEVAPRPVVPEELCTDCIDNDGNGLTDLADPACVSGALVLRKTVIRLGRSPAARDNRLTLKATLPVAIADLGDVVRLTLVAGRADVLDCEQIPASAFRVNKKRTRFRFKRRRVASTHITRLALRAKPKRGLTRVLLKLRGVEVPEGASELALSLHIGNTGLRGTARLRSRKRKLVFP